MSLSLPFEFQPIPRSLAGPKALAAESSLDEDVAQAASLPGFAAIESQQIAQQSVSQPNDDTAAEPPRKSTTPERAIISEHNLELEDSLSSSNGFFVASTDPSELLAPPLPRIDFEPSSELSTVLQVIPGITNAELESITAAQQLVDIEPTAPSPVLATTSSQSTVEDTSLLVTDESFAAEQTVPSIALSDQKNTIGEQPETAQSIIGSPTESAFGLDSSASDTQPNPDPYQSPANGNSEAVGSASSVNLDSGVSQFSQVNLASDLNTPAASSTSQADISQIVSERVSQTLIQEIQTIENGQTRQITLELHPAELGRLTIHVSLENDVVRAQIVASEATTSDLLNRDKNLLLETLDAQGLDFDSLEVSYGGGQSQRQFDTPPNLSTFAFDFEQQNQQPDGLSNLPTQSQGSVINVIA